MKNLVSIIILLVTFQAYGQSSYIGVDLGTEIGKQRYFSPGLSVVVRNDSSTFFGRLSYTRMINIGSKNHANKIELTGYNNSGKFLPLAISLNSSRHMYDDESFSTIGFKLGLFASIYHGGSGFTLASISYGRNFIPNDFKGYANENYISLTFNTNAKGFIELVGYAGYKFISIFHPNWS